MDGPLIDPLERFGITISERTGTNGERIFTLRGNTYEIREVLRDLGGEWDGMKRHWVFTDADPVPLLLDRIGTETFPTGLADALQQTALANTPHYWGHRQRLRDRFLASDDSALPDYELLELLLFFAIPRKDTKPIAKELLARFHSLGAVTAASEEQLATVEGMSHFTLTLFKALRVIAQRLTREELVERPVLDNWDKLVAYLRATMAHRSVEQFRLVFLDRRNVLIGDEVQHEGSIDHTMVYPREVVKRSLQLDASAVVMVHNHPSNHPQPSKPDIAMTREVRDALEKVGVALHDHLIISKRGHTSFRQMGLIGG